MDRVALLKQILEQNPQDAFARYGLAMEYSKAGSVEEALAQFNLLLEHHPEYVAGYQMAAQMLASAERPDEARSYLQRGISAAESAGNGHAVSEMQGLLEDLFR